MMENFRYILVKKGVLAPNDHYKRDKIKWLLIINIVYSTNLGYAISWNDERNSLWNAILGRNELRSSRPSCPKCAS